MPPKYYLILSRLMDVQAGTEVYYPVNIIQGSERLGEHYLTSNRLASGLICGIQFIHNTVNLFQVYNLIIN